MMNAELKNIHSSNIFLLYEGLPRSIIESQVLVHVRCMVKAGISMEVWAFAVTSQSYSEARNLLPRLLLDYGITIRVFRGIRPALPFSERMNSILLFWWMWRLNAHPHFVHARTEHAAAIAALTKLFRPFKLIWDARGDSQSEFKGEVQRLSPFLRWLAPLKERAISKRLKFASKHSDLAIFVSDALRRLQGAAVPVERTLVVPCVADESLFFYSPALRAEVRAELGYKAEDIVITYVGSTASWQCIPDTLTFMETVLRANPAYKVLIVTTNGMAFEGLCAGGLLDRIHIVSGSLKEMNRFLNAADYGVLLRKKDAINYVASPVKYAEYSLAGLMVVTTDGVDQVNTFGHRLGNIVDIKEFLHYYMERDGRTTNRLEIALNARVILGRGAYVDRFTHFYKLCQ